jgi:peptidoglycan/LPS O-acetylase OafA/YrhL
VHLAVKNNPIPGENNFDLVRLLAALQVFLIHSNDHLGIAVPSLITFFPGVPIFFMVSGFLVTASLARSSSVGDYIRKRALRIFPALWTMTLVTLVLLLLLGHLTAQTDLFRLTLYVLGQATFFQIVDGGLGLFQNFGTGGVNGVLWTIETELQFYVVLPLMMWCCIGYSKFRIGIGLFLFVTSVTLYCFLVPTISSPGLGTEPQFFRYTVLVLYTSVLPHLFGFLFGVGIYFALPVLVRLLAGKVLYWIAAYAAFVYVVGVHFGIAGWDLEKNVALMLGERTILAGLVFSFAFSFRGLSDRLLRGNDISYGVYIYHMLAINTLLDFGVKGTPSALLLAATATLTAAILSWRLVERVALRLKTKATRQPDRAQLVAGGS